MYNFSLFYGIPNISLQLVNLPPCYPRKNPTSPPSAASPPYKGLHYLHQLKSVPWWKHQEAKIEPQLVHKPFSLTELKPIKAELGSFSDNLLNILRDSNILLWLMK